MKKAAYGFLIILLSLSGKSFSQSSTQLGLHGVSEHYPELGASVLRTGTNDYRIREAIEANDRTLVERTRRLDSLGYTQVFYLIHNEEDEVDLVDMAWQRIPEGEDKIQVFQDLDTFLMLVGPHIDWIQINQEPMGITSYDTDKYSIDEILSWWRELADYLDEKRTGNPGTLGHLKILSPSISSMIPSAEAAPIVDTMIAFGEEYCDAISLHVYPETVEHGRQTIEYYRSRTSQTLASTEFSQAKAGVISGWLYDINTVWTDTEDPRYGLSNDELIRYAYDNPLDSSEWKAFINTAPYTENFIPELYAIMDSNCFAFACYACLWQYGEPVFDWAELLANKTVIQPSFPNNPFYEEYTGLSSQINSGNYASQCPATSIHDHSENQEGIVYYPNPALSQISLKSDWYIENAKLKVYNTKGELILQSTGFSGYEYSIDCNDLASGIYYVQLLVDNRAIDENRIIVE